MARNANLLRSGRAVDATPTKARREESIDNVTVGPWPASDTAQDFVVERDGVRFARTHPIVDPRGASRPTT